MTRGDVTGCPDLEILLQEHRALLTAYGAVQRRCNALLDAQALQVQSLTAQVVRLRAALVVRDTARALSIANKHWHKDTMPAVLCVGTQGPMPPWPSVWWKWWVVTSCTTMDWQTVMNTAQRPWKPAWSPPTW